MGFSNSEIGSRFQAIVESGGIDPAQDKSRDRRRSKVDTICYSGYPTSCKPDAAPFAHSPTVKLASRLRSITYAFRATQAHHLRMFTTSIIVTAPGASAT